MKLIVQLCTRLLALAGSQGTFGTVAGQHWRFTLGAFDPKLDPGSAREVSELVAKLLHLVVLSVGLEISGVADADLSNPQGPGPLRVSIVVNRSESEAVLEVRYFGKSPESEQTERTIADQVRSILRALYPASMEVSFIRFRGLFGP